MEWKLVEDIYGIGELKCLFWAGRYIFEIGVDLI